MRYVFAVLLIGLFALAFFSCQGEKAPKAETQEATPPPPQALEGVTIDMLATDMCLGCDMSLAEHAITDTAYYNGALYGFCNAKCKESFKADPEAALAKLAEMKNEEEMTE